MGSKIVRSVIDGPFPMSAARDRAPIGYEWIWLTNLAYQVLLPSGVALCRPLPYLRKLPAVMGGSYGSMKAEITKMIDEAGDRQKPSKWAMPTDPFLKDLPTIAQYTTDFWWEKPVVKPRTPCKIAITFFGESVNVTLNDEEKRRSMHTTAATVREALELMEDRLASGGAPWRPWGNPKGK